MENPLIRKLEAYAPLGAEDKRLLGEVVQAGHPVGPRRSLVAEEESSGIAYLILEGVACRCKYLRDGGRQIISFLLPGDFSDSHGASLGPLDHTIMTLSECRVADLSASALRELKLRPAIAEALDWCALVEAAILREGLVSLGRRHAEARLAHLLCEIHLRLSIVGRVAGNTFSLPITQQELADALGLSTVHVNRALQVLRVEELIVFQKGEVVIRNPRRLWRKAGFNPSYLHLQSRTDFQPAMEPSSV